MADDGGDLMSATIASGSSRLKGRGQHTLDSDEEDEAAAEAQQEAGRLPDEAIIGQEAGEAGVDAEGIRFTAFNMNEELEEGHFDVQGNYIFNREKELRDSWLDNIDWVQVKKVESAGGKRSSSGAGLADSSSDEEAAAADADEAAGTATAKSGEHNLRREMLSLMRAGESVARAIRRLGGGGGGAAARWRAKRQKAPAKTSAEPADRAAMLRLSGLADQLVSRGDMDVYEATFELLTFHVAREEERLAKLKAPPEFDMFSDAAAPGAAASGATAAATVEAVAPELQVLWEYCLTRPEAEPEPTSLFGPFDSQQMQDWCEQGFPRTAQNAAERCGPQPEAATEVFVRRVGLKADFYSSRRIEFDLYI